MEYELNKMMRKQENATKLGGEVTEDSSFNARKSNFIQISKNFTFSMIVNEMDAFEAKLKNMRNRTP